MVTRPGGGLPVRASGRGRALVAAVAVALLVLLAGGGAACERRDASDEPASAAPVPPEPPPEPAAATAEPRPASPVASSQPAPTVPPSLTLLGVSDLGRLGGNGDIAALDGFAYVGGFTGVGGCPGHGVRIVDLADPADPRVVATAAAIPDTTSEDVVAVRVSTPAFTGSLLAAGIQRCNVRSPSRGGLALFDVTDPHSPVQLSFFDTAPGPGGVHELDVTVQDGRVLALLAVPRSEPAGTGDLRIVEVTDPRRPVQLAHWGVGAALDVREGIGCNRGENQVLAHSVRAGRNGTRAYVSYWDAGAIILDIADPARPRVLGRLVEPDEEGNIHSVDEAEGDLLLVAEEVIRPLALRARAEAAGATVEFAGCESPSRASLRGSGGLAGGLVDLAGACAGSAMLPAGAVALVDASPACAPDLQARHARDAGAAAMLLVVGGAPLALAGPTAEGFALPLVTIGRADGDRLRALLSTGSTTVTLPTAMPYGGVRLWDVSDPARPVRRALFRTEHAVGLAGGPSRNYSAHNPLSLGRYALVSWFNDGVRLLDLTNPDRPLEVASWVAPAGSRIWGVALDRDLVLLSDANGDLVVLRLAGIASYP